MVMKQNERDTLYKILTTEKWKAAPMALEYLQTVEVEEGEEPKGTRTLTQNKALHKDCALIAKKLNDAGKDMRIVLRADYLIPWTTESVKEHIFRPIMKALYGKESTTELNKLQEIDKIHEVIMRELGEKHGIEWHDFPHDPTKQNQRLQGTEIDVRRDENYPEYKGEVQF